MRLNCGVGTNLKSTSVKPSTHRLSYGNKQGFGGDRDLHPSPESCATYHGKCTIGPVRNLKPDLSATLERPRGTKQSRPPGAFPEVSIREAQHPGTLKSVRAGPAPGLTQVQSRPTSPCLSGSPAPPSAALSLFPVVGIPSGPTAGTAPLPTHRPPTRRLRGRPEPGEPGPRR